MSKKDRQKTGSVTYKSDIVYIDNDGVKLPEYIWKTEKVDQRFVQRFRNCVFALHDISILAHEFLDWVPFETNDDLKFNSDAILRKKFIEFVHNKGGKLYKDGTVDKAIQKLATTGLIIKIAKGSYRLNSMYFWKKDNSEERLKAIVLDLEFMAGTDTTISVTKNYESETSAKKIKKLQESKPKVVIPAADFNGYGNFKIGDEVMLATKKKVTICKVAGENIYWWGSKGEIEHCNKKLAKLI